MSIVCSHQRIDFYLVCMYVCMHDRRNGCGGTFYSSGRSGHVVVAGHTANGTASFPQVSFDGLEGQDLLHQILHLA